MPSFALEGITANGHSLDFDSATLNIHPERDNEWWIQLRMKRAPHQDVQLPLESLISVKTADAQQFSGVAVPAQSMDAAAQGQHFLLVLEGQGELRHDN